VKQQNNHHTITVANSAIASCETIYVSISVRYSFSSSCLRIVCEEVRSASALHTMLTTRPNAFADPGLYDPKHDHIFARAPVVRFHTPQVKWRSEQWPTRLRGGPQRVVQHDVTTPGPGAYTPQLHINGRPSNMERQASRPKESAKGGAWQRGHDGLLVPPASISQLSGQRPVYSSGRERTLLKCGNRLQLQNEYGNMLRPPSAPGDVALYGSPSRYPPRTPDNAFVGLWWHQPRGKLAHL
jgi:hypothetical protein